MVVRRVDGEVGDPEVREDDAHAGVEGLPLRLVDRLRLRVGRPVDDGDLRRPAGGDRDVDQVVRLVDGHAALRVQVDRRPDVARLRVDDRDAVAPRAAVLRVVEPGDVELRGRVVDRDVDVRVDVARQLDPRGRSTLGASAGSAATRRAAAGGSSTGRATARRAAARAAARPPAARGAGGPIRAARRVAPRTRVIAAVVAASAARARAGRERSAAEADRKKKRARGGPRAIRKVPSHDQPPRGRAQSRPDFPGVSRAGRAAGKGQRRAERTWHLAPGRLLAHTSTSW